MMAPAPSQIPDAVPAVTVPFFLKTGGSLASPSRVVDNLGCSSTSKDTSFFLTMSGTGDISPII